MAFQKMCSLPLSLYCAVNFTRDEFRSDFNLLIKPKSSKPENKIFISPLQVILKTQKKAINILETLDRTKVVLRLL